MGPVADLMRQISLKDERLLLEDNCHRTSVYDYEGGHVKEVFQKSDTPYPPEHFSYTDSIMRVFHGFRQGNHIFRKSEYHVFHLP